MRTLKIKSFAARRGAGMTLVELLVAVAASSLMLAAAMTMWIFSMRSFAAAGNYMDLDAKSRGAVDLMLRDLRDATEIVGYQNNGSNNWLRVTNAQVANSGANYAWDSSSRKLICQRPGEADWVFLTECDAWDFQFYQRTPHTSGIYVFYPATNAWGTTDVSIAKLVNMSWKCSRNLLGRKANTENVQTAQVVLRNKR
jgi:type II secretory pathway pseudopilin PulG